MHKISQTAVLAVAISKNFPRATAYTVANAVAVLQKATKAHLTVETNRCNYPYTEAQEAKQDKRLQRLRDQALQALADCQDALTPYKLELGGDPRGACGSLTIDGREYAIF